MTDQEIMTWQSTPLVTVYHREGDYLGMFFGYYSLIVYCIPFVYLTLMLRDRHLLSWVCCGSHFVHELLTKSLKRLIGEPRPSDGPPSSGLFDGPYGMPSQHVACNSYVTMMVILILFHHYRGHGILKFKLLATIALIIGLWIQCQARVHLKYHNLKQVLGGLIYGCISSSINYLIIEKNMYLAPKICRWPIFRHLGFTPDFLSKNRSEKKHFN